MRKPDICICENKDADQLRGNREADQRLCFRYTDSTIPLLPKYEISSFQPSSVTAQPGLCRTKSETPKTGFLRTRLNFKYSYLGLIVGFYARLRDKATGVYTKGFVPKVKSMQGCKNPKCRCSGWGGEFSSINFIHLSHIFV